MARASWTNMSVTDIVAANKLYAALFLARMNALNTFNTALQADYISKTDTSAQAIASQLNLTGALNPTSLLTGNGGFKDEDDMTSDSATAVASQQSIKAYVDGRAVKDLTGHYDSDWFSASVGNAYAKTHNLGSIALQITILFAPDSGGSPNLAAVQTCSLGWTDSGTYRGVSVDDITTTTFNVIVQGTRLTVTNGATVSSGHLRVLATRVG